MGGVIVYGTEILSDIVFPLDLPTTGDVRCTVSLSANIPKEVKRAVFYSHLSCHIHGRHVHICSNRKSGRNEPGQLWCYEVEDVVRFYWSGRKRYFFYEFFLQENSLLLSFWFIHLCLPLYLTLEDIYVFLHAAGVEIEGRPVLFIAPSMGGKSTLTQYFVSQGHALIADDKLPTFFENETLTLAGSHPYCRPYRKFEELGYRADKSMIFFKPIHCFYVLEQVDAAAGISLEEIRGYKKFEILQPNSLYIQTLQQPARLQYLADILNTTRVFALRLPRDVTSLKHVYKKICTHSTSL